MPIEINQSEEQNIKVSRKMNIAYGILSSTQTLQYSFPKNPIDRGGWWYSPQGRKGLDTTEAT